jgi:ankyrin repeat protein
LSEDNSGAIEIIKFLASKGADVSAKNNDGDTPIEYARKKSHEWGGNDNLDEVVECLSSVGEK